jgi:uncharacterized membrane protein YvbJ
MVEERVIQVFCDECSRGVLVWKESMYKCTRCGRQVCQNCFDISLRQCIECCRPVRDAEAVTRTLAAKLTEEEQRAAEKRRKIQSTWTGILSIVAFVAAAALITYFLVASHFSLNIPDPFPRKTVQPSTEE